MALDGAHGFMWLIKDLWLLLALFSFLWLPLVLYGSLLLHIVPYGYMAPDGLWWLIMASYGLLWLQMAHKASDGSYRIYDSCWFFMASLWLLLAPHGLIRLILVIWLRRGLWKLLMAFYGFQWLQMDNMAHMASYGIIWLMMFKRPLLALYIIASNGLILFVIFFLWTVFEK